MSLELYLAFVAATVVLLVVPGPTITLVVTTAIHRGQAAGMAMVPGVVLGDLVAAALSLLGVGAILSTSATIFTLVKLAGALYLIYLGLTMWRQPVGAMELTPPKASRLSHKAFWVTVLNPKSILFFVAFLPQFVDPSHSAFLQMVLLGSTFVVLGGLNAAAYAWLAGRSANFFGVQARMWLQRAGGTCLVGAGALALASGRD